MSRLADEMRKTFASMHVSRNFRLFFVGQLISVTGTWVNWTAGAVLVLKLTDSGVALGIEAALLFLPVLLFGVYAGSVADRFDKRRILVWSNAGYAVLAALQFALVATDVVQIWMVFVIAFLTGLILAIEPPTRQSFYVELVGEEHITNAISLNSAVFTGTRVLGGAIAGTMIDTFGLWSPFLLDAVSYVGVIAALLAMRIHELHPQRKAERTGPRPRGPPLRVEARALRVPLVVMAPRVPVHLQLQRCDPAPGVPDVRRRADGDRLVVCRARARGRSSVPSRWRTVRRNRRSAGWRVLVAFGVLLAVAGWAPTFVLGLIAMVPVGYASMLFAIRRTRRCSGSPGRTCADG